MRILFVLTNIETEKVAYTTVLLGLNMHNMGHEVYMTDVRQLSYYPDGHMGALGYKAPKKKYESQEEYLNDIKSEKAIKEKIVATALDVLFVRNDPSKAPKNEMWQQTAGVVFGQVATRDGVIVLNDPFTLSDSVNKMYFQQFPEEVRPVTIITRDAKEVKEFYKEHQEKGIVVKPLQGSGGQGVFVINKNSEQNLNSMIEANLRDGYIIVQEYLPEAAKGDIRLFMMNGEILECDGKVGAMHRYNTSGDARSNLHVGGEVKKAKITDRIRKIADRVRPKLVQDGLFLVGLDIAGDKLMEVNIFSPGGLTSINKLEEVNFAIPVIKAIERKVEFKKIYGKEIPNKLLNTL